MFALCEFFLAQTCQNKDLRWELDRPLETVARKCSIENSYKISQNSEIAGLSLSF